jgi:UPF0271 protein
LKSIDINADVGEGLDDELLMPYLTSVSIACGGHAGDRESMRQTIALASAHALRLGAHPSYPDRENFGRRAMDIDANALRESLQGQVAALLEVAAGSGARITHVKAHGALYNRAWQHHAVADLVAAAVAHVAPGIAVFCPPGSAQAEAAGNHGLRVVREVFVDRAYDEAGALLSREEPGAVVTEPAHLKAQLVRLASLQCETMCVHGDNPAAPALLRQLREEMGALRWKPSPYSLA